jgi:hypothetical protein
METKQLIDVTLLYVQWSDTRFNLHTIDGVCACESFGVRLIGCFFLSIFNLRLKLADFSEIFVKNGK